MVAPRDETPAGRRSRSRSSFGSSTRIVVVPVLKLVVADGAAARDGGGPARGPGLQHQFENSVAGVHWDGTSQNLTAQPDGTFSVPTGFEIGGGDGAALSWTSLAATSGGVDPGPAEPRGARGVRADRADRAWRQGVTGRSPWSPAGALLASAKNTEVGGSGRFRASCARTVAP